jgi:hypothetical protein
MKLSVKRIASLKAPGRYPDGHNLYLQIMDGGSRSWIFRYQRGPRERWLGLGPLHTVSLKDARERARLARLQLLDGIDPLDAKRERRATQALETAKQLTFRDAAEQYYAIHADGWRNEKHRKQFLSTLEAYAFPIIGHLAVSAIDTGLVLKCIEPHWAKKTETMSRVRQRIERVLEWCTVPHSCAWRKGSASTAAREMSPQRCKTTWRPKPTQTTGCQHEASPHHHIA